MADEFKLNNITNRAAKAKALIEDELLSESFRVLRESYMGQLMATNVMQSDVRDKCYMAVRVLDVVQSHLKKTIDEGKVAQSDLKELAKTAERKKLFG